MTTLKELEIGRTLSANSDSYLTDSTTMTTPTSMARDPVTDTETVILQQLVEALTKTKHQFCCGGTIAIPSEDKLKLFYDLGSAKHARIIDMSANEAADIEKLLEACVPSPHGRGAETVYDDSYRLARELRQGQFALTIDPLNLDESGILDSIAALTSCRNSSRRLTGTLDKLNVYATGGFFKPHRDTPKSEHHIGTVVIALPTDFEGGALRVSHEGKDILFDWGDNVSGATDSDSVSAATDSDKVSAATDYDDLLLQWAFLFSDVEHEVLPVTSGTRITLSYDIFVSRIDSLSKQPALDGTTLPFYSDFEAALKNPDFLPRGGKLGLALSHAYPVGVAQGSDFFANHLKGQDAALHRVLLALQIPIELRAVYAPDGSYDEDMAATFPSDGFGPDTSGEYGDVILHTTESFYQVSGAQWESEADFLQEETDASVEPEIIWARKPTGNTYSESGSYIAYGNEASLATVYAAAALVLDIPPMNQGVRTF